jgi:hypothetical protein
MSHNQLLRLPVDHGEAREPDLQRRDIRASRTQAHLLEDTGGLEPGVAPSSVEKESAARRGILLQLTDQGGIGVARSWKVV